MIKMHQKALYKNVCQLCYQTHRCSLPTVQ